MAKYSFYFVFIMAAFQANASNDITDWRYSNDATIASMHIPDSISTIGDYSFYNCKNLSEIYFSDSLIKFGEGTFSNCKSLSNIQIPNSITSIANGLFGNCEKLETVILPDKLDSIGDWSFSGCTKLNDFQLPNSTTYVGFGAFYSCKSLTKLIIPESVCYIGDWAFFNCSSLTEIHILSSSPIPLDSNVFYWIDKTKCALYVPIGSKNYYQDAPIWNEFINIVEDAPVTESILNDDLMRQANNELCINRTPGICKVFLFDISGKLLISKNIQGFGAVRLNMLASGVYIVVIESRIYKITIKIIKIP